MCEDLVAPYDGATSIARNSTERSILAEKIIRTFIRNRAAFASVKWEDTDYELFDLYRGLYNACQKKAYKKIVTVSMRQNQIILKRIG